MQVTSQEPMKTGGKRAKHRPGKVRRRPSLLLSAMGDTNANAPRVPLASFDSSDEEMDNTTPSANSQAPLLSPPQTEGTGTKPPAEDATEDREKEQYFICLFRASKFFPNFDHPCLGAPGSNPRVITRKG